MNHFVQNLINASAPDAETYSKQIQARLIEKPDIAQLMQDAELKDLPLD